MGPKLKRISPSDDDDQEKKTILAREKQRRRRARLIGGEVEEAVIKRERDPGKERPRRTRARVTGDQYLSLTESDISSLQETTKTFQETPEEISVEELEIKEECLTEEEDENTQKEEPKSEPLPGPKGQVLYYDGVGYYYNQLDEDVNTRWLQCTHVDCSTLAQMRRDEGASIRLVEGSTPHHHPPNSERRDRIVFLHRIKTRHANEHTPFSVIFQQEAYKNPVGASFFSFDKIQAHMQKKIQDGSENLSQESVLSAASTLSMISLDRPSPPAGPVAKKIKVDDDPPPKTQEFLLSGKLSKKLEILKSLKDVSFTERETSEPTQSHPNDSQAIPAIKPCLGAWEVPKPSERLPGPHPLSYVYHDGSGYFYKPLSISGNTRYLQCNSVGCPAQAVMALEENSPISLEPNSPNHNHPPQTQSPKKSSAQSVVIRPVKITLSESKSHRGTKKENKIVVEEEENHEAKRKKTGKISLSKIPEVQTRKQSERIQGPEYYYDFKGHYYFTTRCEKNKRYLRCLFPTCIAEAVMTLEDNAEIQPVPGSRPHNHQPDLNAKHHIKIKQWEDQWAECLPSERLPSLRVQYCCYHDGRGYYYHQTSQSDNIRYLACSEPRCPVRGHMCTQKDAPITLTGLRPSHNHGPDHTLRDALLFIDAVRVSARFDSDPATAITQETTRNPVGAGRVNFKTLQHCLEAAAEIANNKSKEGIVEDEVDFEACLKPRRSVTLPPSTESQIPGYNHFASPRSIVDDSQSKTEEETTSLPVTQTKSELIPALLSDSWLYHDGGGYYYTTRTMNHDFRYLQCVSPKCGARGLVRQAGGLVKLQKPHSHGAQPPQHRVELWFFHKIKIQARKNPDAPLAQIYREVAEKDPEGAALMSQNEVIRLMDKFLVSIIQGNNSKNSTQNWNSIFSPLSTQAEKLPTTTFGRGQYHDSHGFYYTVDNIARKPSVTYLKCISRVTCRARATLVDGKVTMIASTKHSHKPDLAHRDICVFTHTLKKRARDEVTPVSVIYQEEAKKYPKAAAILREDRLKGKLTSIRKYVQREINVQTEEGEYEDNQHYINQSRLPSAASDVIPGKTRDVHHDGRGFYYHETFATSKLKYLICCEPHCLAQAKKERKARAPVVEQAGTPRHCHAPDPLRRDCLVLVDNIRRKAAQRNVKFETIYQQETAKLPLVGAQIPKEYLSNLVNNIRLSPKKGADSTRAVQDRKEEDELWCFSEPCERLPSEHGWVYHNDRGYFYYSHETDKTRVRRILRCCENGCDATAWLDGLQMTRAPGSVLHNHAPEPRRRSMLLLLHRVATRAQLEHANVAEIFAEEAKLDSEGAALIPKNKLNETFLHLTVSKYFKELEEEELSQKENTSHDICGGDEVTTKPCETLHSASSGNPVYHDSDGHYFTELLKTPDKQYVKCLMPLCEAQGYIVLSDPWELHIPLSCSEHNHKPDLLYRNKLLFIQNLRQRVLNEDTPVHVIYIDECEREPLGADLVSEVSIKNLLYKLRKSKSIGDDVEVFPYEDVSDDLTEHIRGVIQKVFEPRLETKNDTERVPKATGYREVQAAKPTITEVKMAKVAAAAAAEVGDEYTEEEYLEEERLEDEPIAESFTARSTNETSMQTDAFLPSEKLPTRNNKSIYHDGQGYYFHFNALKENVMYFRCTESRCLVRATRAPDRDDAPIIPTKDCVVHNHQPDFTRRTQLLFVHHCKLRAANEINLTISEIWDSEVARDPETTSQLNAHNVKAQMKRYRIEHAANSDILATGETQPDNDEDGITFQDASITDPLAENELLADIHQGAVPEKIPSLLGEPLWHAAGYFYSSFNLSPTKHTEKVKCVEKECVARAQVTLGDRGQPLGIKLIKNTVHCHPEDLNRRNQLLFIDRCKKRAATTLQSVEEIYYDEAAKAPEVASQLSAVRVKRAMGVAKKEKLKKGVRVDLKESEDSGDSGDHGMSELGEMANIVSTSTPLVGHTVEVGGFDGGDHDESDSYYPEESLEEDIWTIDPRSLSRDEKSERKRALGRERQRRRRTRLIENPEMWEQLEKEKEASRQRASAWQRNNTKKKQMARIAKSKPKTPKLGPKFLKDIVTDEKEEEYEEQDELVDEIYSDYVTLEEDLETGERDVKIEGGGDVGSSVSADQTQEDSYTIGY